MTDPSFQSPHAQSPSGAYGTSPYAAASSRDEGMNLETVLDFLYRQRLLILISTAVVVAATVAYVYTREPSYSTSSLVRVELGAEPRSTSATDNPGVQTEDVFATNTRSLAAEVFLLQTSNTLRNRVQERLEAMRAEAQGGAEEEPVAQGAVFFDVADQEANTIRISASSKDPQHAALLANVYAEEYVQLTAEAFRGRLSDERSRLEELEEQQRQELERIEAEQRARAASGSALGTSQTAGVVAMQISTLEGQRDQVRTDLQARRASLRAAESELAALEPRLAERVASDDEGRLQEIQSQLASLRSERSSTVRRYPDPSQRDPRVTERLQQLDADIQRLDGEAQQLSRRIVEAGGLTTGRADGTSAMTYAAELRRQVQEDQATIQALEQQAERIDGRLAEQYAELRRLPQAAMAQASQQIAQAQAERERAYAAQSYEDAASQLRDIRRAEESSDGYARLMQSAWVPSESTEVPPSLLLLLGTFIGLSVGFGLALVREKVDNRVYKPEQLREWGYPVLATIPNLEPLVEEEFGGDEYVEVGGQRLSTRLVSLLTPMSPPAEAFRHLRTNVLSRPGAAFPVRVLLVTSPGAQDGKSTTAANLAVSLAQGGHRTLLLDADLRRPSIHKIFGIPRSPGLIHHLAGGGRTAGAESGGPEVMSVGIDDLFVVPAGEVSAMGDGAAPSTAPATALTSAAATGYLQWLREQFDFVVIDTPPLLATTDALQLARQCDAVIVTVRARQTREGELTHVLESLEQVGAPVVGTVLNGFDVSMAYGYKYRYRSYTEYGPYPDYGHANEKGRRGKRKRGRSVEGRDLRAPMPDA